MSWKNLIPQLPEPPQHTPEPDFRSATCLISPATSLVNYERSAQEVARLYNIIIDRDFEEDCKGNYYGRDSMKNERLALSLNKAVMKAATLNIL